MSPVLPSMSRTLLSRRSPSSVTITRTVAFWAWGSRYLVTSSQAIGGLCCARSGEFVGSSWPPRRLAARFRNGDRVLEHPVHGWTGHPNGARQWSTVTPVAFDRHPKSTARAARRAEVADMLRRSCVRVDLTEPREIIVTAVSAHPGVPPAHAFPRLHRKDGSPRRHTHAILVFDEPVCGPILLGAGRYRGYGFCRPLDATYAGRRTS